MTHPIPGADSERPLPPLPVAGYWVETNPNDYYTKSQMVEYVLADRRAAAKVGANVAAGLIAAADFIGNRANDYINEEATTEFDTGAVVFKHGRAGEDYHNTLIELADDIRNLAAGAPAETPKPAYESIDNQQFRNLLSRSRRTMTERAQQGNRDELVQLIDDHCRRQIAAQPLPAPIAGDVEKDALDAERYRWLRHGDNDELVMQRGPVDPDYVYLPRNFKLDEMIDAHINRAAAMLANSSSGEAG